MRVLIERRGLRSIDTISRSDPAGMNRIVVHRRTGGDDFTVFATGNWGN
jgi:hypothetical protein